VAQGQRGCTRAFKPTFKLPPPLEAELSEPLWLLEEERPRSRDDRLA